MKITFNKALQAISHPELIQLYLLGSRRLKKNIEEYRYGLTKLSNLPAVVRIEPTNRCNLKCIMCPTGQSDGNREIGYMDFRLYRDIIDQIADFPYPTWLILYLGGEPLSHPDIGKMIKYAKDNHLYCRFNTNATLLTDSMSRTLIKNELDCLGISFDDVHPVDYEKMRVNAKYDKTLMNILNLLETKDKYGSFYPLVSIESLKLKTDASELKISDEFKKLFKGYSIQNFTSGYAHMWAGDFENNPAYNYERSNNNVQCTMLWHDLTINWEGQVVACCYDLKYDCVLGDVKKESLKDIWNNKKMVGVRKIMLNGEYHLLKPCNTCSLIKGEVEVRNF